MGSATQSEKAPVTNNDDRRYGPTTHQFLDFSDERKEQSALQGDCRKQKFRIRALRGLEQVTHNVCATCRHLITAKAHVKPDRGLILNAQPMSESCCR
jgi:hypothetical protein